MTVSSFNRALFVLLTIVLAGLAFLIISEPLTRSDAYMTAFAFLSPVTQWITGQPPAVDHPWTADRLRRFAAASVAVFASLFSLILAAFLRQSDQEILPATSQTTAALVLIVSAGTLIRLMLATVYYGNYDMTSYEIVASIFERGGNVYAETERYNYSPVWFFVLGGLKKVQSFMGIVEFHTVVRSFLCTVDLLTLLLLILIARHEGLSTIRTAVLFYMNPVSFLITGYHGQFENLTILMILAGFLAYYRLGERALLGRLLLWFFGTMGMIIKHIVFYNTIVLTKFAFSSWLSRIFWFGLSATLFMLTFMPYFREGYAGIIDNVLLYSSGSGRYGITSLVHFEVPRECFVLGLFIFPLLLTTTDIVRQCLICTLFFLVFTTGIAVQYFVLPIAFAALRPSSGAIVYSCAVTAMLLGSPRNLDVPGFRTITIGMVWPAAIYWFMCEMGVVEAIVQTVRGAISKRYESRWG